MSIQRLAIAVFLTLLAIAGIYRFGFSKGWKERDNEMQAVIAQKNEESRQIEQKLTEQLNSGAKQLQEANNVITQKQTDLTAAIRAGRVRLPAPSCVQASTSSTPSGGDQKDGAKLDRQADQATDEQRTLELIAQIAADGDKAINQLNACVDAYNQVREQLNGHK
jgi:flagellar capping protein FliD